MRGSQTQVLLGTRVPASLKERLSNYCRIYGIKMNYFIAEAIKEKLLEIVEEKHNLVIAKKRLKKPDFISQKELDKYLHKRGLKS